MAQPSISLGFDRADYNGTAQVEAHVLFFRTRGGLTKGPFKLTPGVPMVDSARAIMQREAETTGVAPVQAIVMEVQTPNPVTHVPGLAIVHWWDVTVENVPTIHVREV